MLTDHKGPHHTYVVVLNAVAWVMLLVVLFAVAATVLATYDVFPLRGFQDYGSLQYSIFVALSVWGLKFHVDARRYPTYKKYSWSAFAAALVQMGFLLFGVR